MTVQTIDAKQLSAMCQAGGTVYKHRLKVMTMKAFMMGLILFGFFVTAGCSQNAAPPPPADPNGHMPGGSGHGPGGPEHRPGNQDERRDR